MKRSKLFQLVMALTLGVGTTTLSVRADDHTDRPQVSAATSEAVAKMRDQIEHETIHDVTVGEIIRKCHGEDELTQGLMRAELVGGARWVDNDTCQVQLEMSGTRVARIISHIAASSDAKLPISKDDLANLSLDWQRRTFSGSGSSTAFNHIERVRPRLSANSPWSTVPDSARQKALAAAKEDAIAHVIDSIKPIEIAKGKTVGDALAQPDVHKAVMDWLAVRPVIRIEYRLDLQVDITMAGTANGLFDTVRHAVTERSDLPIPKNEAGWSLVRHDFETHMATPTGRGSAAPAATSPVEINSPRPRVAMPSHTPDWAGQRVDVEAVAEFQDSKLKGAREAEAVARRKLVEELNALPLGRDLTVGKAAERDPRIHDAVQKALDKARTTSTDYTHKKGVSVTLQLDLGDLWDALRSTE